MLENGTILKIKCYDEIAEDCYKKLREGNNIVIAGTINDLFEVIIEFYEII